MGSTFFGRVDMGLLGSPMGPLGLPDLISHFTLFSNVIEVFILNFVSFQLSNHITFHFIIFISKHPSKRDKYLIHFNFFSFFFILYILFHSIYFSQVKNSIMLPSCNGLYRLTAQLVDADIANRNCNYSSDRLNWIKVDSLLE